MFEKQAAAVLDVDATSRLGLILAQRKGRYEEADVVFDPAAYPTEVLSLRNPDTWLIAWGCKIRD